MFSESFLPQATERLILRRVIELELERFLVYRQHPQVARFQGWSMPSDTAAQSFINEMQTAAIGIPSEWFQIAIVILVHYQNVRPHLNLICVRLH